jgi:hypothetical protein
MRRFRWGYCMANRSVVNASSSTDAAQCPAEVSEQQANRMREIITTHLSEFPAEEQKKMWDEAERYLNEVEQHAKR